MGIVLGFPSPQSHPVAPATTEEELQRAIVPHGDPMQFDVIAFAKTLDTAWRRARTSDEVKCLMATNRWPRVAASKRHWRQEVKLDPRRQVPPTVGRDLLDRDLRAARRAVLRTP